MPTVTIIHKWTLNEHVTRFRLNNGWFVDRMKRQSERRSRENPYELYEPGADACGGAKLRGTARTLKAVLELAGCIYKRAEYGSLAPAAA